MKSFDINNMNLYPRLYTAVIAALKHLLRALL